MLNDFTAISVQQHQGFQFKLSKNDLPRWKEQDGSWSSSRWWGWEGGSQSWELLSGQPLTFSWASPASWDESFKKINCPPWFEQDRSEFALKCGNFLQPGASAIMSGHWEAVFYAGFFHSWQMSCVMGHQFAVGTSPNFSLCRCRNSLPSHPQAFTSTFALWQGAGTGCFGKK